ncbi:hypothetical protein B6G06_01605 [Actinomyces gaoshouyii]|nr:hypothetical protein B6G06_01605 [Actinomyces gaoshouyii]
MIGSHRSMGGETLRRGSRPRHDLLQSFPGAGVIAAGQWIPQFLDDGALAQGGIVDRDRLQFIVHEVLVGRRLGRSSKCASPIGTPVIHKPAD